MLLIAAMDDDFSFALDVLRWTTWELQIHLLQNFPNGKGICLLTVSDGKEEFGNKAKGG